MMTISEEGLEAADFFVKTLASVILVISLILLIAYIVWKVAYWKIFSKAGEKGWKSLIPIYNQYILCKIVGVSPWWMLICAGALVLSSVSEIFLTLSVAAGIYFNALISS